MLLLLLAIRSSLLFFLYSYWLLLLYSLQFLAPVLADGFLLEFE